MDLNPKTNAYARASYEVVGGMAAFIGSITLLRWLIGEHPMVFAIILTGLVISVVLFFAVAARAEQLKGREEYKPAEGVQAS